MENFENKEDDFLSILKELEYMEKHPEEYPAYDNIEDLKKALLSDDGIKKEDYASSIASVGHDSFALVASSICSSLTGVSITSAKPSSLKLKTSSQMLTHCPHPIHLS